MGCGCGKEVIERGAALYLGKTVELHNGLEVKITNYDPEDVRRFAFKQDGNLVWFNISDIKELKQ
jgi:hypothetical protein